MFLLPATVLLHLLAPLVLLLLLPSCDALGLLRGAFVQR
jgi:hypothetical protein